MISIQTTGPNFIWMTTDNIRLYYSFLTKLTILSNATIGMDYQCKKLYGSK